MARRAVKQEALAAIEAGFPQILGLRQAIAHLSQPRRLEALFRDLAKLKPSREPDDIEELIWALWIGHDNAHASADMAAAVEAMSAGAMDLAAAVFDRLVLEWPDWAEAWNKRATLAFIAKRDAEALADIAATLRLEPRHFGAIAGFGQICLRHSRLREASAAFQMALTINPHLQGVAEVIRDIADVEGPMH